MKAKCRSGQNDGKVDELFDSGPWRGSMMIFPVDDPRRTNLVYGRSHSRTEFPFDCLNPSLLLSWLTFLSPLVCLLLLVSLSDCCRRPLGFEPSCTPLTLNHLIHSLAQSQSTARLIIASPPRAHRPIVSPLRILLALGSSFLRSVFRS